MNKENIKSIALFLLVVTSAVLTIMVWSYQPEFSEIDTDIERTSNIGPGEPVSFDSIMRAYQLVWVDDSNIQGTIEEEAVVGIREYIDGTEITDINVYNSISRLTPGIDEDSGEEFLIVDYASDMPTKSLFKVLDFNYEGDYPDYSYNRIVVDLVDEHVTFYLINENLDRVAVAETNLESSYLKSLLSAHDHLFEEYSGVITNQQTSNNKTAIYGPTDPGSMPVENFLYNVFSADTVNNMLFLNDSFETEVSDETYVYEGDTNIATYNSETYAYSYNNLRESLTGNSNPHQTIQSSFHFLNSHIGLDQRNILFDYFPDENNSVFRASMNGYFVFSDHIPSTISVKYGQNALYEYNRPLLRVTARVPGGEDQTLPPLESVRYEIALNENYDLQDVTKITIGYNMAFSTDQSEINVVQYTPSWYIKYDGEWMRFDEGGLE